MEPVEAEKPLPPPPPRAFTQGVGTVFQFAGGILFIALSLTCCGSGLLLKGTAEREDLTRIFTLDRRHFSVYRPGRRRRFSIVPE